MAGLPIDPRPLLRWGWGLVQKGEKFSTLPLRFGLATIFLLEGWSKLASGGRAGSQLLQAGFPGGLPEPTAVWTTFFVFGFGEFLLGLLFLAGAFTRYAAALASAEMILTVGLFGIPSFFASPAGAGPGRMAGPNVGIMKDAAILGAALALGFQGSYVLSVDGWLRKRFPGWMV